MDAYEKSQMIKGVVKQPPRDFKATMDYKDAQIRRFNDAKQESMRIFASGRDATEVVNAHYASKGCCCGGKHLSEKKLREKILDWRRWYYVEIYGENEQFYQENNKPF